MDKLALLSNYLQKQQVELNTIESVLVLSEKSCIACIRSFALVLENQLNNPKSVLIVSSKGTYVDISVFLDEKNNQNVIHDFNENSWE